MFDKEAYNMCRQSNLNARAHEWDGKILHPVDHVGETGGKDHDSVKERAEVR